MNYKTIFLGTSALWPFPRLGCQCKICQSKNKRDKRLRSSILIEGEESSILFDIGPDIHQQLLNHQPERVQNVFITHSHHDHILGFDDFSRVYNRKSKVTIYATDIATRNIKRIFRTATNKMLFRVINLGDEIKINDLVVIPFVVEHTKNEKTLGFSVGLSKPAKSSQQLAVSSWQNTNNRKIPVASYQLPTASFAYIPDCQDIPSSSLEIIKDAGILIVDGSSLPPQKFTDHWSMEEAIGKIKKWNLKASRLIFTHLGHLTGGHQELENFAKERSTKKLEVGIGYDGMKLELSL